MMTYNYSSGCGHDADCLPIKPCIVAQKEDSFEGSIMTIINNLSEAFANFATL